jgi:hypothetical protein
VSDLAAIPHRDGQTYDHARDARRLAGQQCRVLALMKDGQWRTLSAIAAHTKDPEASVSARLRDLRKPKFGGWEVERRYVERGLWEYRLKVGQLELVS